MSSMFDKRNARIVQLIQKGETYEAIARRHGVTRERIRQIGKMAGVKSVRRFDSKAPYRYLSDKQVTRIVALHARGMPLAHIAETVASSDSQVRRVLVARCGYESDADDQPWSKEEVAFVRQFYKTPGWSAAKIGAKLGRTRDEIIGKANRLKMTDSTYHARLKATVSERRMEVKALRASGLARSAIANKLGVAKHIVDSDIYRITHGPA